MSDTELEIMQFIWKSGSEITFRELLEYFNTECNKNWKKQTLNTYLLRLSKKGFLKSKRNLQKTIYIPTMTLAEYRQTKAKEVLAENYEGSLKNFVVSLSDEDITQEEAEELISFLKSR